MWKPYRDTQVDTVRGIINPNFSNLAEKIRVIESQNKFLVFH